MTVIDHAARLARLGLVLRLREVELAPLLAAAAASDPSRLVIGASVHGRHLELVMPYHPAAFAAVATSAPPRDVPAASMLRIQIDGDALAIGIARSTPISPRNAVDEVAPAGTAAAWFDLVEQLCSICDARIVARTAFEIGAAIDVAYPDRGAEAERILMAGIDQLAGDLGISAAQRRLWLAIHPELSHGRELAVATRCTATGPAAYFALGYPITGWDVALRLGEGLVLGAAESRQVPAAMGQLAGALGSDQLRSIELVLGPDEPPDVIVWADLASRP